MLVRMNEAIWGPKSILKFNRYAKKLLVSQNMVAKNWIRELDIMV